MKIKNIILWLAAFLLMVVAVIYQRATGPTYPFKGKLMSDNKAFSYKLLRSQETSEQAPITLPKIQGFSQAQLHYKRYKTQDSISSVPFELENENFVARLPIQPAAGKMEYYITGEISGQTFRIPQLEGESIILRYKDPVPKAILIPHVLMMIMVIFFGMRAALSAIFEPTTMRKWVIVALIAMSIGGLILGPIVQKYAFGEFWTGFPYGKDFTDNKTLLMWLSWLIALIIIGFKPKKNEIISRIVVVAAALMMTIVYLIPHSMGGSTLDYSKVDQGIHPSEAIQTGK